MVAEASNESEHLISPEDTAEPLMTYVVTRPPIVLPHYALMVILFLSTTVFVLLSLLVILLATNERMNLANSATTHTSLPLGLSIPPFSTCPMPTTASSVCPGLNGTFLSWAQLHNTDKVSDHRYDLLYEDLFAQFRCRPLKLLEIGLGCNMQYGAGHSLPVWYNYFPQADIHFLEYDADCASKHEASIHRLYGDRVHVHTGDQANLTDLERLISRSGGNFDVIIDDGGHTWQQQHVSLDVMLPSALKPGGVYVVEDLLTSGAGLEERYSSPTENFVERLIRLQRFLMWELQRGSLQAALTSNDRTLLNLLQWILCAPGVCAVKRMDDQTIQRRYGDPL